MPPGDEKMQPDGGLTASRNADEQNPALEALLFETSPYGNLDAIVQHDHRVLYFYLSGDDAFGTRACWVRNLVDAPYVLDNVDLEQGVPPLMPRTHCRSSAGQPLPIAESLQFVWLEEGNGVTLFEYDELIAVIPPWSGSDGFHGYSTQCVIESPLAWPLPNHPDLFKRIENARQFWLACASESAHPYAMLQPQLMTIFRASFGDEEEYYSLDSGNFPPCGAALFRTGNTIVLISVGMSFRPQPNVELFVENPSELRRIELGIQINTDAPKGEFQNLLHQFSGLVAHPWQAFTWFGPGHSCQMSALAGLVDERCDTALLVADRQQHPDSPIPMPEFRGDPIQLLWLDPVFN